MSHLHRFILHQTLVVRLIGGKTSNQNLEDFRAFQIWIQITNIQPVKSQQLQIRKKLKIYTTSGYEYLR